GLISLIRPRQRLGIRSRRVAAWVLAVGILAFMYGTSTPAEEPSPAPPPSSPQDTAQSPDAGLEQEPHQASDEAAQSSHAPTGEDAQHTPESEPTKAAAAEEPAPSEGAGEEDEGLRPGVTQATVTGVVDGDTI